MSNQNSTVEHESFIEKRKREFPERFPPFSSVEQWVRYNAIPVDKTEELFTIAPHEKGMWLFVCLCSKPHGTPLLTYHCDDTFQWLLKNFRKSQSDGTIRVSGNCPRCHKFCDFRLLDGEYLEWSSNIEEVANGFHKWVSHGRQYGRTAEDDARDEQQERAAAASDPRYIVMLTGFGSTRRLELAYAIGTNNLGETVKFKAPGDILHRFRDNPECSPRNEADKQFWSYSVQRPVLVDPAWVISIEHTAQE